MMKETRKRILLIKFGALGDVVRSSHVLPGLWQRYEAPAIYWLTSPGAADLLRFNPYISHLVTPQQSYRLLAEAEFDLVISLDDEREILHRLNDLRYRALTGAFLADDVPAYTEDAAEWFDMGLISRFGKERADQLKKENRRAHHEILASILGITIDQPEFFNSPLLERTAAAFFHPGYFNIGLNSGAGGRWEAKGLPEGRAVELIKHLLGLEIGGRPVRVYLLGGADEKNRHAFLRRAVPSPNLVDAGNDNSLLEFAAIVRHCDYVITSDSLALHLAIAQGVPNLSFYAPTSAAEIGTFGTGVKVVSLAADYCSYRKDADNATLTAERILEAFTRHVAPPGEVS